MLAPSTCLRTLRRFIQIRLLLVFVCFSFCVFGGAFGSSASARDWSIKEVPQDLDQVDIYLHTVDVGNLVFNNFGHTAVRVHDRLGRRDVVYNWGIFDFGDPLSFSLRFYKGILFYSLGVYPYPRVLEAYKDEGRSVWQDKLNLNAEEKKRLIERLIWNAQPENRQYSYQYFFDNCSTRPRDYIDEAIEGRLKRGTVASLTPVNFRDMMMDGYKYNPGIDLFLDLAMNNRLDRPISVWEKMFHPIALRDTLLKTKLEERPLVSSSENLATFNGPNSYEGLAYPVFLIVFGVPLLLVTIGFFLLKERVWLYRSFAIVSLPLLAFGAFMGVLMPLTWAVSAHLDLHHNALQLLFWPLDFLLVPLVLGLLWRGRALRMQARNLKIVRTYIIAHLLVSMLLPVLRSLDLIQQNVDRALVYVLPPYLVIIFILLRVGFKNDQEGVKAS